MPELVIGFTAARDLDERGQGTVINVLATLPHADRYITGGARGGDAFLGRWLARDRPEAEHIVIVPADKSCVDPWWDGEQLLTTGVSLYVIEMRPGTTYKDRNAEIVRRSTMVCGFPACIERHPDSQRSGTWQTIRMSRRVGKLHRWDTVKWPHAGCVEKSLAEFDLAARDVAATHGSENRP